HVALRPEEEAARERGHRGHAEDRDRAVRPSRHRPFGRCRHEARSCAGLPAFAMTRLAATAAAMATRMLSLSGKANAATAAAAETIAATHAMRSLSSE